MCYVGFWIVDGADCIGSYGNRPQARLFQRKMKQLPSIGSKITYKGAPQYFWFKNIIEDANNLLEIGKEYTISRMRLNSSWVSVVLEEFPDHKFSLSFFDYVT